MMSGGPISKEVMDEPRYKKKNELWTVEAGEYEDHQVLATFDRRPDAVAYRDNYNKSPKVNVHERAFIGTIAHNPNQ